MQARIIVKMCRISCLDLFSRYYSRLFCLDKFVQQSLLLQQICGVLATTAMQLHSSFRHWRLLEIQGGVNFRKCSQLQKRQLHTINPSPSSSLSQSQAIFCLVVISRKSNFGDKIKDSFTQSVYVFAFCVFKRLRRKEAA